MQPDQRTERMADHAKALNACLCQRLIQLVCHLCHRVVLGQRFGVISGPALVVAHHLILLLQHR
ncbi:hypothetical protein D3C76_1601130 [compost metagenome]